jgi:hypothetical protein
MALGPGDRSAVLDSVGRTIASAATPAQVITGLLLVPPLAASRSDVRSSGSLTQP